jgi:hypothetical protein
MSDVKAITIVGSEMNGGHIERKRTRSKKQKEEMGGLSGPIPVSAPVQEAVVAPAAAAVVALPPSGAPMAAPAIIPKKIILAPKKRATKIVLTRKHHVHPAAAAAAPHHRPARKITLGMIGHKRRITRARRLHKESRTTPLDEIRKKLVEKGVIKETSKAPESVLRQLYADTLTLAQPTL